MNNNDTAHKHKMSDAVLLALKEMKNMRNEHKKQNSYNALLDTTSKKASSQGDNHTIRFIAPLQKTISQHLILVHKARDLMSEYLSMKSFILDVYGIEIAKKIGFHDTASQQKMRVDIKNEMEENFKNLTNLSARLASEKGSALDKDLAHNELRALTEDLRCRLNAYQPYYQAYLADNHCDSKILYEV